MAVTSLTIGTAAGVKYTVVTDTSADWPSVANSTYFYDKADKLVHYKDSAGVVQEIFSAGGGLTKFTEAESTTAPNATVYVDSLTAAGSTTNVDVAIVPKGTGAFMLDVPDNTTAGGNKRGANAIDLQTIRGAANQVAAGQESVVIGSENRATDARGVAIGYQNVSVVQRSTAVGSNNTANGVFNSAFGYNNNVTSDERSLSAGAENVITQYRATAIGNNNTSSGIYSVTVGSINVASAWPSLAIGFGNTSNAANSLAIGSQAHCFGVQGRQSMCSNIISTAGDSQKSLFILKQRTTDNTVTVLTTNNNAVADTTNQVILSNQSAYRFKGSIIAKQSGSTNIASWDIDGLIVRGANAASTTLNVSNVTLVQNTPAWGTPTLAADVANGGLIIKVTGAAATNIQWVATVETTEVIYA